MYFYHVEGDENLKGKLIVIDGLDGSGKETQAKLLAQSLRDSGRDVLTVSFPVYESPASAPVRMYLSGEFGSSADDVNPYAASAFFAVDRFASFKKDWQQFYQQGGLIIADRYTTSNVVHQCSKLPKEEWDGFAKWLFGFEYDLMGIPSPDGVIYLRVDPEVSQKLMSKRYDSDENKKDIHERDVDYLRRSLAAADHFAESLGWNRVECVSGDNMRTIEDISRDVLTAAESIINK